MRFFRVLSLDGGGIRGIIPATVLAHVEALCKAPVAGLFDLIVGTSTGGILALGLTAPDATGKRPRNEAATLLGLYGAQAETIFPGGGPTDWKQRIFGTRDPSEWVRNPHGILWRSAQHAGAPFGGNPRFAGSARYFGSGLEETLDEQIGDTPLGAALTRVLVTSYDMAYGEPVLFSSFDWPAGSIGSVAMRVAARATSAGPTFFEPQAVDVREPTGLIRRRVLVDGGVFANNPSLIAYSLGGVLAAQAGLPLFLLSVGTGMRNPARPLTAEAVKTKNWLGAARAVFEAAMTGSGAMAETLLPALLNATGRPPQYVRIQTSVESCNFAMDDSSAANTACLAQLASAVVARSGPQLEAVRAAVLAA